jgi:1-acyl-sn-glycerol-3-phosphate acyltransferase
VSEVAARPSSIDPPRAATATALRSFAFNVVFYVTMVGLMFLGLPTFGAGRRSVIGLARLWGRVSTWLLKRIAGLRIEYRGLENLPVGGFILASKHESFLETFALLEHAPDFAIILKKQLVFLPLFGLYLLAAGQIAIDRAHGRAALAQMIAKARAAVADGREIFIYPEGTRRPPGAPPRYKSGVAALYAETGAPCLPVALNTGLYWARRGFIRRPGVAVIEYLPPIPPGLARAAFLARLEGDIEAACARLNAEAVAADPRLKPILAAGEATVDKLEGAESKRRP